MGSAISRGLISAIRWYQRKISPGRPPRCRYSPSCSSYAVESLKVHGAFKGTILIVWRLLRCNPLTKGGVDRVPGKGKWPGKPLDHDELMDLYKQEDAETEAVDSTDRRLER